MLPFNPVDMIALAKRADYDIDSVLLALFARMTPSGWAEACEALRGSVRDAKAHAPKGGAA